jgi:hypothetical protein
VPLVGLKFTKQMWDVEIMYGGRLGVICSEMRNKNMAAVRRCSCRAITDATWRDRLELTFRTNPLPPYEV